MKRQEGVTDNVEGKLRVKLTHEVPSPIFA